MSQRYWSVGGTAMKSYRHILVLIHDERDGLPLLRQTVAMVRGLPIALTVGHLNADYAELEYGSDALVKDRQAQEVIAAKAMLSRLVSAVEAPVAVKEIVTIRRFKDVSDFIHHAGIDLVVVNGVVSYEDGKVQQRQGRMLRRQPAAVAG